MKQKKFKIDTTTKKISSSKISIIKIFQLLLVVIFLLALPQQNSYAILGISATYSPKEEVIIPSPAPYPINFTEVSPPEISAEGIVIMDVLSGTILYEKNPDIKLLPASTTKIMTALVALEDYHLDESVEVKTVIDQKQIMGLTQGEKISVENLLYGILVHSANDAAYALAEHHQNGVPGFIDRMNEKANAMHLTNTNFVNPIGFDDPNQYTTAMDLARLSSIALQNPVISKMVGIPQITVADVTFTQFHSLKNVNELLGKVPGVSGFKTGFTQAAGQALVTTVSRNGDKIIIVLLRSSDRFGETETLIKWVFENYKWETFQAPN